MKKLLIILSILVIAIISIGCQKEKVDEVAELQKKRMLQMEYVTKLYQFNVMFCRDKKYWEVEEYVDSISRVDSIKIAKLKR